MRITSLLLVLTCALPLSSFAQGARVDSVFAPTVVGVPPSDAYIGLSLQPSGEIRYYNYGEQKVDNAPYYLSSQDNGFTWKRVALSSNLVYADVQSPKSGEFVRAYALGGKVYSVRTRGGVDGGRDIRVVDEKSSIMVKPPVFIRGGERVVVAAHSGRGEGSLTYISDDDGLTWQKSNYVTAPLHEPNEFDKSYRWNHGAVEPTVTELADGRLWMVMRTSQDMHYQAFSEDGGLTWSESSPSPFYATITMPTFQRMRDGRLLFFWSNTTPLPEVEGNSGQWDDVFTNRNATHVAISEDDGKTWIGVRELFLDQGRNDADFASKAGQDKSVHQAQCIEPVDGKLLVAIGQNQVHRKMVMFDVDWLYEKRRSNSFENGLEDWSAFKYYKGVQGHCGYNRVEGDILRDHSDTEGAKMINIRYIPNDTLVCDNDGAVWNFPAAREGSVTTRVKLPEGGKPIKLILNDRWFNAADTVAAHKSIYVAELGRDALKIKDEKWHDVEIKWSYNGKAQLYVDGRKRQTLPLVNETIHGVSYLHFISGNDPDEIGVYIDSVSGGAAQ